MPEMDKRIVPALYTLIIALSLANCVQEIDFSKDNADAETLVVSGAFTDGAGPHTLQLSRTGNVEKQVFQPVPGAQVTLSDDQGNHHLYAEIIPGHDSLRYYQLSQVQGVPGRAYSLEIRLPDGQIYRTQPEIMPTRAPIDSAEVRGEWFVSTNSNGTIVREPFAYVYAHATAPDQAAGRYLRWEGDAVYIFDEVQKIYNPFATQHQCFISSGTISAQIVPLAKLEDYAAGTPIRLNIGKRRIDNAFESRICFNVYQHSISRAAYEYWQKISELIAPTGTIFDPPPARAIGNVANETHPEHPALGYFEIAAVDTARGFTRNGLLGKEFLLSSIYCDYDWSNWPPVNHPECDDCLKLANSTYQQPEWWQ